MTTAAANGTNGAEDSLLWGKSNVHGRAHHANGMNGAKDPLLWTALAIAIAGGIFLRWYQLDIQIVLDDEWHALHKLLHADYDEIRNSFGLADHSIPLTLYYRYLFLHGGLDEWRMRAPLFAAGVLLLIVVPLAWREAVSLSTRMTWTALIAISPLLVYFSKVARPYALTTLLTFLAVLSFWRWWCRRERRFGWGALYVIATVLAAYLHPVNLAFTALPFAYCAVLAFAKRAPRASSLSHALSRLFALGAVTLVLLALALGPPLLHDWNGLAQKSGRHWVSLAGAYRTLLMLCGTRHGWMLVLFVLFAAWGGARLWRRDCLLTGYWLFLTAGYAVIVAATGAMWIGHPLVYARYLLPALPFLLLFVAEGVTGVYLVLRRLAPEMPLMPRSPILLLLPVAALATGPLPASLYYPNQFFGHLRFQYDYDDAKNPYVTLSPKTPPSAFYRQLASLPPASITIIEAPWRLESNFNPHPFYQALHRQLIKIGLTTPVCGERSFGEYPETMHEMHFEWFVPLSAVLRGESFGARYLVLHRSPWKTPPDYIADLEWPDMTACLRKVSARLGAPVFDDGELAAFELTAGRSR